MNLQDVKSIAMLGRFIESWNKEAILTNPNKYIEAVIEWDNDCKTFNAHTLNCVIHIVDLKIGYNTRHIAMRYTVAGNTSNGIALFPSWYNFVQVDHSPASLHTFFILLNEEIDKIKNCSRITK